MFDRFRRNKPSTKLTKLAQDALREAARLFESGEFRWLKGDLLANGGPQENSPQGLAHAGSGCVLGSISKAAWIVAGRPKFTDKPGWLLKKRIENRAYAMAFQAPALLNSGYDSYGTVMEKFRTPFSYNDRLATGAQDVVDAILKPALDVKLDEADIKETDKHNVYTGALITSEE